MGAPNKNEKVDIFEVPKEYPDISDYCNILNTKSSPAKPEQAFFSKLIEILGKDEWKRISSMPRITEAEKREAFIELLRALRPRLIHAGEEDTVGEPLSIDSNKYATTCQYTTNLVINGLRELEIHAEAHTTAEFTDIFVDYRPDYGCYGHSFPWAPELCLGLSHGDDLYSSKNAVKDTADLLKNWREIKLEWKTNLDAAVQAAESIDKELREEGTVNEETKAQEFRDEFKFLAVDVKIEIPCSLKEGTLGTIVLSLYDVIQAMPAPLILYFRYKTEWWYKLLEDLFTVQKSSDSSATHVKNPLLDLENDFTPESNKLLPDVYLKRILTQELQTPEYRLPETRDEAVRLVVHLVRLYAVKEKAIDEAAISIL